MALKAVRIRNDIEYLCHLAEHHLPVKSKLLFLLRYRYGHTYNDIAKITYSNRTNVTRRIDGIRLFIIKNYISRQPSKKGQLK